MNKGTLDGLEIKAFPNGLVTINLDGTKRLGPSASGKTIMVATTHGAAPVQLTDGSTLFISINAYIYPPRKSK